MESGRLTIGALAADTNCTVPAIRYYEEIGLLPLASRGANGRRYYGEADRQRLLFIRRCRDFGFSIERVRELTSMFQDGERSCVEVRDTAQAHLQQVRVRIEELRQLEASLQAFVHSCDDVCLGGPARDCTIIEDLSAQPEIQGSPTGCGGMSEGVGQDASSFREVRRY
jgi:DNA-binding transcriptional MerR regulator